MALLPFDDVPAAARARVSKAIEDFQREQARKRQHSICGIAASGNHVPYRPKDGPLKCVLCGHTLTEDQA